MTRRRRPIVAALVLLTACTATTTTITAAPSGSTSLPGVISSPSPTPTANETPESRRPEVRGTFSEHHWVEGKRLGLAGGKIHNPEDCTLHTFTMNGKTRGAFRSGCQAWESDGYDILIFYVGLKSVQRRAMSFDLPNFALVARDGRSFGPVNVRSKAETPANFLPETGKLPPHSHVFGYLTFDGRATGVVPARLSYIDGDQTLTVVFDGRAGQEVP